MTLQPHGFTCCRSTGLDRGPRLAHKRMTLADDDEDRLLHRGQNGTKERNVA